MMSAPVTGLGSQARAWATLGAINHALDRVLDTKIELVELDVDRLKDLKRLIEEVRRPNSPEEAIRRAALSYIDGGLPTEQLSKLAEAFKETRALQQWLTKHKVGIDKKLERLDEVVGAYVAALGSKERLGRPKPSEEFQVLAELTKELVQLKTPYTSRPAA